MAYITTNYDEYKNVIYSGGAKHRLKIWFNDVELENADNYCEKLTIKSRIIPNGSKIFMLDNFISKEATLILRDIDLSVIQDQVRINIETLVNGEYVGVPMGIFNLQDKPTTDNNKTTFTLRDNSVKFDFNYNAKDIIENNGGSATKLQILQDICSQADVTCNITSFIGSDDPIGIYDNTITARVYISFIAEQAGAIPYINRNGELIFIYINDLYKHEVDMWYVEKYENGDKYKIGRTVYESGIIKYENGEENDTLYLDSANPYISSQEQLDNIHNIVKDFEINSFKTGKVIGNPAIDPYDLVSFVDLDKDLSFTTLATNELVYTGVLIQTFDTEIGLDERTENVSLNGEETFKKWARTEIDNVKGEITQTTGRIDSIEIENNQSLQDVLNKFDGYTPLNRTVEIEKSVTQLQTDTYTKTEINTKLTDGSVKKVLTTTVLIDDSGQTIDNNTSKTKSNMNADGFRILDKTTSTPTTLFEAIYDEELGATIVRTNHIEVDTYLTIGHHSRIEDYEDGTGIFYIG